MIKFLVAAEILAYFALSVGFAFGFIPVAKYSSEFDSQIATAVIFIVFSVLFLLSASASKNYFLFRTPFISFLILILCFSANISDMLISNDLFSIVIFSLAFVFFASKGEAKLFFSSFALFGLAIFAFVFYDRNITPTNVFFVSFSLISAFFSFISSHFNNKMEIFKRESELKERIAHKIQNIGKRGKFDFT
jgi:hypothetical protein